ncbi:hypothetical protein [Microbacterium jejuense]|uniref:hypothetical protein n=1 Tax=Microbacterium jejuense TaxID=1263637 RepID=UPI0031ED4AD6
MISDRIDRRALVRRHNVTQTEFDPRTPVSVGNGEFAFTADLTGLQTFPDFYPVARRGHEPDRDEPGTMLGTQAQWAWHSIPGEREYSLDETTRRYDIDGRSVPYLEEFKPPHPGSAATTWFRANPHRIDLARIGFVDDSGAGLDMTGITAPMQTLDLFTGVLHSEFTRRDAAVAVETAVHPDRDLLAVRVGRARDAGLAVAIAFPYGSSDWHNAADWSSPGAHRTVVSSVDGGWVIERELDGSRYRLDIRAADVTLTLDRPHRLVLRPTGPDIDLTIEFTTDGSGDMVLLSNRATRADGPPVSAAETVRIAEQHWRRFWESGSAVALDGPDERARELERRVVLSQFLTAVHSSGSLPPQETGLMCNSWRGKFHLEMHWWHAAHFPMWGRPELLRRSLDWYRQALPLARSTAAAQGYRGARWPKQLGSAFRETPSTIGVQLIWQQPHPIALADLVWRATGDAGVLADFAEIVEATADFMADYARPGEPGFTLGPPLVPAQERYAPDRARISNPTFELAYWRWALRTATAWRERLGLAPEERWAAVADGIAAPHVRDGVYTAVDVEPFTIREDHPSMLGAWGILPDVGLIDPATMRETYRDVLGDWDWQSTWGWDYPMMAMTAARLGEPDWAVDALLDPTAKNTMLRNGHYYQVDSLPLYLPGNGGILAAVALMARRQQESGDGFPDAWTVELEGFPIAL